ncbi:MAG: hypothetical protein O3A53_07665 [Acidobacteria bacterium]|nr:hypothetical protein [Acidobacteriota bacterium]MDA1234662.1 hypothetical protein [Acidobacteriota bacterium]
MTLQGVIYKGPPLENPAVLQGLPGELFEVLWQVNGFIAYAGGLHVRGFLDTPEWHSFSRYHSGEMALRNLYPQLKKYDFPFGQDFLGNQFLLRDSEVFKLRADTGEVSSLHVDLSEFFEAAKKDPVSYLSLELLALFHEQNGALDPGQLIHTMPPLCLKREDKKLAMKAVPADNAIAFLAHFARQINEVPEGTEINLKLFKPPDGDPLQ